LPAVFTDRCLGDYEVPEGLRAAGFEVHTMSETYDPDVGQNIDDPEWIAEMADCRLVLLSKDARIKKVHVDAVIAAEARVFLLPEQGLPAREMIARYTNAKHQIAVRCQKRGPFIYMVGPTRLDRVKLPPKYPTKADGPDSAAARAIAV
jgi:hypothetical protein